MRIQTLYLLFLFLLNGLLTAQSVQLPDGFAAERIADNLNPVGMTIDHHGRIWVVEKHGQVKIIENGELQPDPFITLAVDDFNERGLLGIALHPDMDIHPFVYLYYTVPGENHNRLSRFTANGNFAVPGSEEILLDFGQLNGTIHNGGAMLFGEDGKLYLAMGDGAKSSNSQKLDNLFGKIIRLNEDGTIPGDNPFYNTLDGLNRAIYSYGFRNPFSMTKDEATGRIFVCDVGGGEFEEVNDILPGKNYGWKEVEGPLPIGQNPPADYQDPFFFYPHDEGCAIVGAAFYDPETAQFPNEYLGKFFFADYCNGTIQMLDPATGQRLGNFATNIERPLAIHTDHETGDLYYLARAGLGGGSQVDNTSTNNGSLWRVFYTGSGAPFIAVQPSDVLVPEGEDAFFQIAAFGSQPLVFQWQMDGIDLPNDTSSILHLTNISLTENGRLLRCIASNSEGSDTSSSAILSVTSNHRPQPVIELPIAGSSFRAGDLLQFQGYATDPEDGVVPTTALTWKIDWHHNDHTHPVLDPTAGNGNGQWVVPTFTETDPDVWYRVYLTATDSEGLSQTVYTEIFPELAIVDLTGPDSLLVNVDGLVRPLPYSFESMIGIERTIEAPDFFTDSLSLFYFEKWSDGDTNRIQSFQTPESGLALEVQYEEIPLGTGIGLYGEYFNDPELDLDGVPVMSRVDSVIHYNWGGGSPAANIVPNDFFTVRWVGEIQALFTGEYTFYIRSDDGASLWINDEQVIDHFEPQPPIEHSGHFFMEKGQRYPIRIEYMELAGGAEIAFSWSHERIAKDIVPQRQLYPVTNTASVRGEVWLDENRNNFYDLNEVPLENVTVLLYDATDTTLLDVQNTNSQGIYRFNFLPTKLFYLHFLSTPTGLDLDAGTGLETSGRTPVFDLEQGDHKVLNVSFYPKVNAVVENDFFEKLEIYPNPAGDHFFVKVLPMEAVDVTISLHDVTGKMWLSKDVKWQSGVWQESYFSAANIPSGVYWLKIISSSGMTVVKLTLT